MIRPWTARLVKGGPYGLFLEGAAPADRLAAETRRADDAEAALRAVTARAVRAERQVRDLRDEIARAGDIRADRDRLDAANGRLVARVAALEATVRAAADRIAAGAVRAPVERVVTVIDADGVDVGSHVLGGPADLLVPWQRADGA